MTSESKTPSSPPVPLEEYGQIITQYQGRGKLSFGSNTCSCSFLAGQVVDGVTLLLCRAEAAAERIMVGEPTAFRGETSVGHVVRAEGLSEVPWLLQTREPGDSAYRARRLVVDKESSSSPTYLQIGITNLRLAASTSRLLGIPDAQGATHVVQLTPAPDRFRLLSQIAMLRTSRVTAEISIIPSISEETAEQVADALCYVLSVAAGTKVQWVWFEERDGTNTWLRRAHFSRVTKPYSPLPLIDPRAAFHEELDEYLRLCLPEYLKKYEILGLNCGVIDAWLDARSEQDYLEMRGIKAAVAVELLKSVLLEVADTGVSPWVVDKTTFEKELLSEIGEAVLEVLDRHNLDSSSASALGTGSKILGLNRRSFSAVLRGICRYVGLTTNHAELAMFVACRNKLVHEGRFYCDAATPGERSQLEPLPNNWNEYRFVISFLDRLLLKLLGYSGPFLDWRRPAHDPRGVLE